MKILKRMIIVVCILLLVFLIMLGIIGNYLYNYAIAANTSKAEVFQKNSETEKVGKDNLTEEEIYETWLTENSNDTYIKSEDGLNLHGYELKHLDSDIWTIIVHGYDGQGIDMGDYAQSFYNKGYNVLVVDLRGAGLSDGEYIGMGWHDRLDIVSWIDYLVEKDEKCQIILFGVSMGASTVMMATGEKLPQNVKLAIEDCGYSSVWSEFEYQLKKIFNLDSFPFLNVASITTKIRAGYFLEDASSLKQLQKSNTPTLFIHGDKDEFVPTYMVNENYEIATCEKELLVVEGAEHARSSKVAPDLYWNTIDEFIRKYIKQQYVGKNIKMQQIVIKDIKKAKKIV